METGNIFRNVVELVNINDMICKFLSYWTYNMKN